MMFRFLAFSCLVASAVSLRCMIGMTGSVDIVTGGEVKPGQCSSNATYCVRETIDLRSDTSGHSVKTINYNCDYTGICGGTFAPNATACNDVYIGNMCCCTSDNCNNSPDTGTKFTSSITMVFAVILPIITLFFKL